ncbi:MFS transporter [Acetobacteraceae bacterium H6797]|nr:MFS transporter [Acetobacteraceae bacterium H6797]
MSRRHALATAALKRVRTEAQRGLKQAKELRSSRRGLDWLNFFVADVQTGFGPFVAIYLAAQGWDDGRIGLALSVGAMTMVLGRVPAGVLADATRHKRLLALLALIAIAASALMLAVTPVFWPVIISQLLHGFASCVMVPVLAAISLALSGRGALSGRLGRNSVFAAVGNAVAAGLLGVVGTYVSLQAVFWMTAALTLPAIAALAMITQADIRPRVEAMQGRGSGKKGLKGLLLDRGVLVFAACSFLFTLSNAAMLPIASSGVTRSEGGMASIIVAAGVAVAQAVTAGMSPVISYISDNIGRRIALVVGLSVLPLRGVLLATLEGPWMLVAIQALDGVSAAMLAVLLPLVAADLTRGTNRLNLCIGIFGFAVGLGGSVSTALGGYLSLYFGPSFALLTLAAIGGGACALALLAMPETREGEDDEDEVMR